MITKYCKKITPASKAQYPLKEHYRTAPICLSTNNEIPIKLSKLLFPVPKM